MLRQEPKIVRFGFVAELQMKPAQPASYNSIRFKKVRGLYHQMARNRDVNQLGLHIRNKVVRNSANRCDAGVDEASPDIIRNLTGIWTPASRGPSAVDLRFKL